MVLKYNIFIYIYIYNVHIYKYIHFIIVYDILTSHLIDLFKLTRNKYTRTMYTYVVQCICTTYKCTYLMIT